MAWKWHYLTGFELDQFNEKFGNFLKRNTLSFFLNNTRTMADRGVWCVTNDCSVQDGNIDTKTNTVGHILSEI